MFFFIGGIQPKITFVDNPPVLCPSCGLLRARYKRVDQYISLFFIPIIPIKRGDTFLFCERCGLQAHGEKTGDIYGYNQPLCKNCGRTIKKDFIYCPFCGKSL
ncbi:MAG: zinc ribbon domain-containing protein [Desulfatiglans sp.]|jgi:hypothetical protein|nr:zinc ribbon domain-containing protein [Desulfatiglans sp.]